MSIEEQQNEELQNEEILDDEDLENEDDLEGEGEYTDGQEPVDADDGGEEEPTGEPDEGDEPELDPEEELKKIDEELAGMHAKPQDQPTPPTPAPSLTKDDIRDVVREVGQNRTEPQPEDEWPDDDEDDVPLTRGEWKRLEAKRQEEAKERQRQEAIKRQQEELDRVGNLINGVIQDEMGRYSVTSEGSDYLRNGVWNAVVADLTKLPEGYGEADIRKVVKLHARKAEIGSGVAARKVKTSTPRANTGGSGRGGGSRNPRSAGGSKDGEAINVFDDEAMDREIKKTIGLT